MRRLSHPNPTEAIFRLSPHVVRIGTGCNPHCGFRLIDQSHVSKNIAGTAEGIVYQDATAAEGVDEFQSKARYMWIRVVTSIGGKHRVLYERFLQVQDLGGIPLAETVQQKRMGLKLSWRRLRTVHRETMAFRPQTFF